MEAKQDLQMGTVVTNELVNDKEAISAAVISTFQHVIDSVMLQSTNARQHMDSIGSNMVVARTVQGAAESFREASHLQMIMSEFMRYAQLL